MVAPAGSVDVKGARFVKTFSVVLALSVLLPMTGASPLAEQTPVQPFGADEDSWHRDTTGTGIDDRLEKDLAAGAEGPVVVELRYERRPTSADVELLQREFAVTHAHLYNNWDEVLVRVDITDVPRLIDAPGVVAVEKVPPVALDLGVSTKAIRADATDLVADGFDHSLAAHEAFDVRGEGMVIAVLDTGVDGTHVSLQDKIVSKTDPVSGEVAFGGAEVSSMLTAAGCVDPQDHLGHGTHVAGIALGRGGGGSQPGVAPEARLVDIGIAGVRVAGIDGISIGLDWLLDYNAGTSCYGDPGEDRVDVLSVSLSLASNDPEDSLNRKFTDVVRSGITLVFSAGNSGPGPGSITKGPQGAILVGNVDDARTVRRGDDMLACSSSRGPRPAGDLGVPHSGLMPHVAAPGTRIVAPNFGTVSGSVSKTGTSMAAPHVSGLAALILQANETLRPVEHGDWRDMGLPGAVPVRDVLIQSSQFGMASPCAPQSTATGMFDRPWNDAWGYGSVDAYEAVRVALGGEPLPPGELPDPVDPGPPVNDDLGNATLIPSTPYSTTQGTVGATLEAEEPRPCGDMGSTVWYSLTLDQDVRVTVDTFGSGFDTVLAAYTGEAMDDLQPLVCNDDTGGSFQSEIMFDAQENVTYYIQSGGYNGDQGPLALQVTTSLPPPQPPQQDCPVVGEDHYVTCFSNGTEEWTLTGLWHVSGCRSLTESSALVYNDGGCPGSYDTGGSNSGGALLHIEATGFPVELEFASWSQTEDGCGSWDRRLVQFSVHGGPFLTLFEDCEEGIWQENGPLMIPLLQSGDTAALRFWFETGDSVSNDHEGWFIDQVHVGNARVVGPD